ncbi:MAG: hypothetical protein E6Q97_09865 [Desulfurellales bacterium]|nr:MAG: hypothetical protein E6Q97_09865 [Desulfurellales bacterium]
MSEAAMEPAVDDVLRQTMIREKIRDALKDPDTAVDFVLELVGVQSRIAFEQGCKVGVANGRKDAADFLRDFITNAKVKGGRMKAVMPNVRATMLRVADSIEGK